ncbi:formylglycine-generating enzyme required for sulfatase activity [Shimia isoporae]|uniref:Formylglycine-generating enzyme required for sulfatase activity n=1 Tax=Shimia isoporae TaxID=647720 RepID=A0A4R1NTJ2_9RHOB|nr:formylglycine-generating enzyme family protein [Shimia isoporae]TCL08312.1 formylglycine-generating enzyme required for sulfatase activity [Shimia isoporae]
MADKACCAPPRGAQSGLAAPRIAPDPAAHLRNCRPCPGGVALVGTSDPQIPSDCEGPLIQKRVRDLWVEAGTITVAQFRRFVMATGYRTIAEQLGWSFVFFDHLPNRGEGTLGVDGLEWWRKIERATWHDPTGPQGAPASDEMPVTHVAWDDARAFATWAGGRLPKEAEWEHAARGGLGDVRYPWGDDEPSDTNAKHLNIWQGEFPVHDTGGDGFTGPAPALAYQPNGYGLYQMVGNVWEWSAEPFRVRGASREARQINAAARGQKLLKGGSFLCHRSYCYRYRIAARTGNTPDSTSAHTGFRVVYDHAP